MSAPEHITQALIRTIDLLGKYVPEDARTYQAEQDQETLIRYITGDCQTQTENHHEIAKRIFDSWPKWKRDFEITEYSHRYK